MSHMWVSGRHIAEQLSLNYVFFCEFEELHSPLRSPALQVMHVVVLLVTAVSKCRSSSMPQGAYLHSIVEQGGSWCCQHCLACAINPPTVLPMLTMSNVLPVNIVGYLMA